MPDVNDLDFTGWRVVTIGTGLGLTGPEDIASTTAIEFARRGAQVVVCQAEPAIAEQTCAAVEEVGGTAFAMTHDPLDPAGIQHVAAAVADRWDRVDVLVTHHFAAQFTRLEDLDIEQFDQTVRVNLTGVFAASTAFLRLLRASEHPAMVHAGSIDGTLGNPNVPAYSASKGGVHSLIHVMAAEFAASGIRVNGIARTASTALPLDPRAVAEVDRATPLHAVPGPEAYAHAVLYLASPLASYLTGVILPVDGGRTAVTPGCSPGNDGYATAPTA